MTEGQDDIKVRYHDDRIVIEVNDRSSDRDRVSLLSYRQSTQWHEVLIAGPVPSSSGRRGNSFPGMYYYHPGADRQWVIMVNGPVDWTQCRLDVQPRDGVLELGLFSTLPINPLVSLKVWHSPREEMPSQWEAVETLVTRSFQMAPLPAAPDFTPNWRDLSSRCLDRLDTKEVQHPLAKKLGGIAYQSMDGSSRDIYGRPMPYVELIPQVSIARSLHGAAQHLGLTRAGRISQRLARKVIPNFFNPVLDLFENSYVVGKTSRKDDIVILDTWYALSNLSDILYLAAANPGAQLHQLAARAVATWMAIGREMRYNFPLFLNATHRENQGGKLNVAAGGLYASVMLAAASLIPHQAEEFKAEAAEALTVMRRFPVQQLFHQPELLARAAESAFQLSRETPFHRRVGEDFTHAMLLMMYRDHVNAGLFEGCAGMMYPTFRESVAALVSLASIEDRMLLLPIRSVCELGVSRSYRFLHHYDDGSVLPYEGLTTREMPGEKAGIAIYAAGGVFDLAHLQGSWG
ncbi:hypothetical protein [Actinoplanes sp. NPDC049599]|uniref:hypothetical protein n=1 Tax=Actinoplanes sp. NPDC049599 TaxID=3363903 RepID=UPI003791DD9B